MDRSDERAEVGPAVIAGAGGFIGGHLVRSLLAQGVAVRAVDVKPFAEWHQRFEEADNQVEDLQDGRACNNVLDGAHTVFNLAADMGGMGFIENNKAACMLSVLINTHLLQAAVTRGVSRFFYASSACVYAGTHQESPDVVPLREQDAYPADPEDGYGWEKLFSERLCRHFLEDFGLETRVARFHNVYGPMGAYFGGREKAPAAICRKVIEAKMDGSDTIEIWGDGKQTRTFTYIDDCIKGMLLLARGNYADPVNVGSSQLVAVNQLVDVVEDIAGVRLRRIYKLDAPQGVRGRSSDNTLIESLFGWSPSVTLEDGMQRTYRWIYDQMVGRSRKAR